MIKCLWVTVCYLMSYFFDPVPDYTLENRFSHHLICQGNGMLVAFSSSFYNLEPHFLSSYAMLILSFALLLALLAEKQIYFYNLSEMSFTSVPLCFMADASTCDTHITLFSVEINYPNLYSPLLSIFNASYSKCSKKSYTLSSLFFHLANIQLCCCNLMWKFCLPLTTYSWAQEKEHRNSSINSAGSVS